MKAYAATAMLLCAAMLPAAAPAQTTVKPVYVDDIGEGRRVPFSVTLPLRSFFNCTMLPEQCQTPVPEGKRFVIENIGAHLQITNLGGSTGDIRGGFYVDVASLRTYFPFTEQAMNSSEKNWAAHFPFRAYLDHEQRISCALNGASVTGTPFQFGGDCVLAGYLIDRR